MFPKKVLVVDDDSLIRWALRKELAGREVPVRFAATAREALDGLRDHPCDLIFLDIHLPDGNGIDLLDEIRAVAPGAAIIMLSADASEENRRRASARGIDRFIEKPFDISDIDEVLRAIAGDDISRRKSARYACRVPVRLSIVAPVPGECGACHLALDGVMADVGAGGFGVRTAYPLHAGQRIHARIDADGEPLARFLPPRGLAVVVWVAPGERDVAAGLRFLG